MIPRTLESIASALGGRWLSPPIDASAPAAGVSIDTRTLEAGEVFFAFRGECVDGREYLGRAHELGAAMGVVDKAPDGACPAGTLLVDDLRAALTALARSERQRRPDLRVVGVTGSNGKTTTTRLIESVLSTALRGRCSRKSFNNELGLPLTLLSAHADDEFVVCEMGTSSPGEIARLTSIARPDVAVITSIGRAHLEWLGSIEGVAREKSTIIEGLAPGGVAIVTDDSPQLDAALSGFAHVSAERVGEREGSCWRISEIRSGACGVRFALAGVGELAIGSPGAHNARNGAIAAAVGVWFGLDAGTIRAGLASASAPEMRLGVETIRTPGGAITLINDAYNANPESVRSALRTLASFEPAPGARRVAILGDMLELGAESDAEHAALFEGVCPGIHSFIALGAAMSRGVGSLGRGTALGGKEGEASDEAIARAASMVRPGDVVLLKGSRAMRLERVASALRSGAGAKPAVHCVPRTDAP